MDPKDNPQPQPEGQQQQQQPASVVTASTPPPLPTPEEVAATLAKVEELRASIPATIAGLRSNIHGLEAEWANEQQGLMRQIDERRNAHKQRVEEVRTKIRQLEAIMGQPTTAATTPTRKPGDGFTLDDLKAKVVEYLSQNRGQWMKPSDIRTNCQLPPDPNNRIINGLVEAKIIQSNEAHAGNRRYRVN